MLPQIFLISALVCLYKHNGSSGCGCIYLSNGQAESSRLLNRIISRTKKFRVNLIGNDVIKAVVQMFQKYYIIMLNGVVYVIIPSTTGCNNNFVFSCLWGLNMMLNVNTTISWSLIYHVLMTT